MRIPCNYNKNRKDNKMSKLRVIKSYLEAYGYKAAVFYFKNKIIVQVNGKRFNFPEDEMIQTIGDTIRAALNGKRVL